MVLRKSRIQAETSQLFDDFNASIAYDQRLCEFDLIGSIAHVRMLAECSIIPAKDAKRIESGLKKLLKKKDKLKFSAKLEDIHMNLEALLHKEIGTVAGKLHTARSRNDQVALAVRLYMRNEYFKTAKLYISLIKAFITQAKKHFTVIMPGYTHLQKAQPVTLSHYLLSYAWMFERDLSRLIDTFTRLNECPLGAGALAGSGLKINRKYVADMLGFSQPTANSIDTVSNRDHLLELMSANAISMMHLSRFAEELIIWSSSEFNFVNLPDEFCTTSSMMPQKKNPDLLELIRGKSGRCYGDLFSLLTTTKGLSQSYYKDLQEDKEPLFDSIETLSNSLELLSAMLKMTKFNKQALKEAAGNNFANATDVADYLVEQGLEFRKAHEVVGQLVSYCIEKQCEIQDLELDQLKKFSKLFSKDIYKRIAIENCVAARSHLGGTAPSAVKKQIASLEVKLARSAVTLQKQSKQAKIKLKLI